MQIKSQILKCIFDAQMSARMFGVQNEKAEELFASKTILATKNKKLMKAASFPERELHRLQ